MLEGILEVVFSAIADIIDGANYKNPRIRTWLMTGVFTLVAVLFVGFLLWATLSIDTNAVGVVVMGTLTVIAAAVWSIIIVRSHKKNWPSH